MTEEEIRKRMTYSKPDADRIVKHQVVTEAAIQFALAINEAVPDSRGKSLALTHIEDARMWANQALATEI